MKIEQFSSHLQDRIKKPVCRGQFTAVDSAENQWGLLSVGNGEGKVYVLVNPETRRVEKAKFLAFGELTSILLLDAYCVLIVGRAVDQLPYLDQLDIVKELNLSPEDPSLDYSWISDFSQRLVAGLTGMKVEAPLEDKPGAYKRKEKEDMNEADLAWLPLGAPQKIVKVEELLKTVMPKRTAYTAQDVQLYNVERDLKVKVKFKDVVESTHRPLILGFIQEACRGELHPEMLVEEVES